MNLAGGVDGDGTAYDDKHYTLFSTSVAAGADASAGAYVEAQGETGTTLWGVGRHTNIATASLLAVVSAVNRMNV